MKGILREEALGVLDSALWIPLPPNSGLQPLLSARFDQRVASWITGRMLVAMPTRWELRRRRTHGILTRQAVAILPTDGHPAAAAWLMKEERALIRGLYWADEGWKNVTHYYRPRSGNGLLAWPNAADMVAEYTALARDWYSLKVAAAAAFYLGAAVHLVQDACVPHHAAITMRRHEAYENQAEAEVSRHIVTSKGLYQPWSPAEWIHENAAAAEPWLHDRTGRGSGLGAMLERAQRTTAGFLYAFLATERS